MPELGRSIFVVPGEADIYWDDDDDERNDVWQGTKNSEDRLVILNDVAQRIVDEQRDKHQYFVFTYRGRSLNGMNNIGWKNAW